MNSYEENEMRKVGAKVWYSLAPTLRSAQNRRNTICANRVILNGQTRVRRGRGAGVVRARWRRRGHKGHASLKFEKYGSLAKCASGAPKSITLKGRVPISLLTWR